MVEMLTVDSGTKMDIAETLHVSSTTGTDATWILTNVLSTSGPHLVALAWTGDELSCGQAQNGENFDFEVKYDLEVQSQSPPPPPPKKKINK